MIAKIVLILLTGSVNMRYIENNTDFNAVNYSQWLKNTAFWLENELRHVEDTKEFVNNKFIDLIKPGMKVVDLGCGNGWLIEHIRSCDYSVYYKGIDFNDGFVEYLKIKYENDDMVDIELCDIETDCLLNIGTFDIVLSFYNFFEISNLNDVFCRVNKILNKRGKLVIMTIDYIYLILAISKNMEDFKEKLKEYEEILVNNSVPYFFQKIDMGDKESDYFKYVSVLYSLKNYFDCAKSNSMILVDYDEIVKTSKFVPKVYQYMVFQKDDKVIFCEH